MRVQHFSAFIIIIMITIPSFKINFDHYQSKIIQ